ncbi:DUF3775 domain-containing protein [Paracoccaceae bacterium Fryx2]|nr:DUF3775 domain-containing protein [Paracoccaceae bacterium Fryx2]
MADLAIDLEELGALVLRLKAVMAKEGMDFPELGGNASDDPIPEALQQTEGDLSQDEITQEIETMNDDQQDALVALFWIGRGDAEPEAWAETLELARERHTGRVSTYLLGKPLVATYLEDGLEQLREAGVLE